MRRQPMLLATAIAAAVSPTAGQETLLLGEPSKHTNIETSYPHWSPDGRQIVFQSNRLGGSDIWVMDRDGANLTRLTRHPANDENPAWSPDGRHIVFRSYRDGNAEIYRMTATGGDLTNLTNHPADDIHPYWSADGSSIIFNSDRSAGGAERRQSVLIMRADGTDVRAVTADSVDATYAQLSPDGAWIVFRRVLDEATPGFERNRGNSEIYLVRPDGSEMQRVTHHPAFDGWPSWHPSGRWITFGSRRSGSFQIYAIHPDGSGLTQLTRGPGDFQKPNWSPDGRSLLATRTLDGNVEIFTIDIATDVESGPSHHSPNALLDRAIGAIGAPGWTDRELPMESSFYSTETRYDQSEWPGGLASPAVKTGTWTMDPSRGVQRQRGVRRMSAGRTYDVDLFLDGVTGRSTTPAGDVPIELGMARELGRLLQALPPAALRRASMSATAAVRRDAVAGRSVNGIQFHAHGIRWTAWFDDDGRHRATDWLEPDHRTETPVRWRAVFGAYRAVPTLGINMPHVIQILRGGVQVQSIVFDGFEATSGIEPSQPLASPHVSPNLEWISDHVFVTHGSVYRSFGVRHGDGSVTLLDLPHSAAWGRGVISAIRQATDDTVTIRVIATHSHADHLGGLTAALDQRLDIYISTSSFAAVDRSLRALRPNTAGRLRPLPAGGATFGSDADELRVLPFDHFHASDMVIGWLPAERWLYEVDLIRGSIPASTAALVAEVERMALDPLRVFSSHGESSDWPTIVCRVRPGRCGR